MSKKENKLYEFYREYEDVILIVLFIVAPLAILFCTIRILGIL